MSDFERLENIPINQRIDFPFIIYQSKPKSESQRYFNKKSDKYWVLIMLGILFSSIINLLVKDVASNHFSMGLLIFNAAFIIPIYIQYRATVKSYNTANELANLDLPDYFPFLEIDSTRAKGYDRRNQMVANVPVLGFSISSIKVKGGTLLNLYFKNLAEKTKYITINLYDIDFYTQIADKKYQMKGEEIEYFINYIRYRQHQNPSIDHVILIKKHFINRYPMTQKWIEG